jgi:hypothetical protein
MSTLINTIEIKNMAVTFFKIFRDACIIWNKNKTK